MAAFKESLVVFLPYLCQCKADFFHTICFAEVKIRIVFLEKLGLWEGRVEQNPTS